MIAATLQRSLLPPELPDIPGFRLASFYQAAGEHNDVGGDYYDAFEVPGGWMIVVGDVAGRGAEAAALTSLSRYTFRAAGKLLGDPIAALEQLNAALRELPGLSLVSVCCALLRSARQRSPGRCRARRPPPRLPPATRGRASGRRVRAVPRRVRTRRLGGDDDPARAGRPTGPLHRRRDRHRGRGRPLRRGAPGADARRRPWRRRCGPTDRARARGVRPRVAGRRHRGDRRRASSRRHWRNQWLPLLRCE